MQSLTIIGKRWFQRTNGNTYFSAYALIDGKPEPRAVINYSYGYGNQYEWDTFKALEKVGVIYGSRTPSEWEQRITLEVVRA